MHASHLRLTPQRIKNTRPGKRDIWLSDDAGVRGTGRLYLRVTRAGARSFYFRYPRERNGKEPRPRFLGPYSHASRTGFLTLEQARAAAAPIAAEWTLACAARGRPAPPPAVVPRPRAQGAAVVRGGALAAACPAPAPDVPMRGGPTVAAICRAYISSLRSADKPSAGEAEGVFRRFIYDHPVVAHLPAGAVDATRWTQLLAAVVRESTKHTANRVRTYLHAAYAQAMNAKYDPLAADAGIDPLIDSNPIFKIRPIPGTKRARERVLTRRELREFWRRLHPPSDATLSLAMRAVRLDILLGGQRCKQLLRAGIGDVDLDAGVLRLVDNKGRREQPRIHSIPLTAAAKAELEWLVGRSRSLGAQQLFASGGGKQLCACTVSKVVTQLSRDLMAEKLSVSRFQYADLRRTVETELAALDVPPHVRAHLQSHGLTGVQARHYDKHDYQRQVRQALLLWQEHLDKLLADRTGSRPEGARPTRAKPGPPPAARRQPARQALRAPPAHGLACAGQASA